MNSVNDLIRALQALPEDKKSAEVLMEYDGCCVSIWSGVIDGSPDPTYNPGNVIILTEKD